MKQYLIAFLALILLLTACGQANAQILPTPSVEKTAASAPVPTTITTPLPSPIPSSLVTSNVHVIFECVSILQEFEDNLLEGTLVVKNTSSRQIYLWNPKIGERILVAAKEDEILNNFITSPNGRWLAYFRSIIRGIETTNQNLEIMSPNGQLYTAIPIDPGTARLSQWMDNERVLLRKDLTLTSPRIVINPFTQDRQELLPNFSDLYENNLGLDWNNQGVVVYHPSLTMVIYAGLPADIVLKDTIRNHVIARVSPVPIAGVKPLWSPDGSQFVFANADISDLKNLSYEIYSMTLDGQIRQLTYLGSFYQNAFILSYAWSPDGRYIAFWREDNQKKAVVSLSVLDLNMQQVTDYCIQSTYKGYNAPPPIFWSPNNTQIIIEISDTITAEENRLVLLDITTSQAFQIAKNFTPLGWMIDKP